MSISLFPPCSVTVFISSLSLHLLLCFPPPSASMHAGSSADRRPARGHTFIVMLTLRWDVFSRNRRMQNF